MASLIRLGVDALSGNLRPNQPPTNGATPRDAAGNPLPAPYPGQQGGWYYQAGPNQPPSPYGPGGPYPGQAYPPQNGYYQNGYGQNAYGAGYGRRGRRGAPRVGPNGERRGLAGLVMYGVNAAQKKSKKPDDPSSSTAAATTTTAPPQGPSSNAAVSREEEEFDENEYFGEEAEPPLSECPPYQPGEYQDLVDAKRSSDDKTLSPPPLAPTSLTSSSSQQSDSWQSNNPFRNPSPSNSPYPPASTL